MVPTTQKPELRDSHFPLPLPYPTSTYLTLSIPKQPDLILPPSQRQQPPLSLSGQSPTQLCPTTPPIECIDVNCYGHPPEHLAPNDQATPYRCTSTSSFLQHGDLSPITLHNCRCCPTRNDEPDCQDERCAALPNTYVCTTELLAGCQCSVFIRRREGEEEIVYDPPGGATSPLINPVTPPPYEGGGESPSGDGHDAFESSGSAGNGGTSRSSRHSVQDTNGYHHQEHHPTSMTSPPAQAVNPSTHWVFPAAYPHKLQFIAENKDLHQQTV